MNICTRVPSKFVLCAFRHMLIWLSVQANFRVYETCKNVHVYKQNGTVLHETSMNTCTINFVQYIICQNVARVQSFLYRTRRVKWEKCMTNVVPYHRCKNEHGKIYIFVLFDTSRHKHVYNSSLHSTNTCQNRLVYNQVLISVTEVNMDTCHIKIFTVREVAI